jgi:hypothetical protein
MPIIDKPPISPQAQAQMGPPGGADFGPGIGQAQERMGKGQIDSAVSLAEKILMGVSDDTFRTYATRAIAILKTGAAMAQQKGPQSQPGGTPPPPAAGAGAPPQHPLLPPMPGQLPG